MKGDSTYLKCAFYSLLSHDGARKCRICTKSVLLLSGLGIDPPECPVLTLSVHPLPPRILPSTGYVMVWPGGGGARGTPSARHV